MDLTKSIWTSADVGILDNYLETIKGEKIDWTKKIYNTNKKCFAVKIPILRNIAKEILKGNFYQLLHVYFEKISINSKIINNLSIELNLLMGILICNIKDVNIQKHYLVNYAKICDSWAETDIIKLKIKDKDRREYFNFAINLLQNKFAFVRRLGIIILFNFLEKKYAEKIFNELNKLKNEQEYYVNMAISWLLCELFIKLRDETIYFLNNCTINYFVFSKFVSKCRDSFRVSADDKNMLYKRLKN